MRYKEWRKRQNERPESAPPPSAAPNDPWWTRAGDPRPGDPWWLRYGQSRDRDGRYGRRGRRCNLNLAQFLPAARPKLFFAVFLVCAGAVLFLDNIGLLAVHDVWAYWPLIFVAMGISRAANISCGLSRFWGGLLVLGGIGLVLNNLGLLYIRGDLFWPLLLIVFGAMTLLKTVDQHRQQTARFADAGNETSKAQPDSLDHNSLREWVVFGNTKRRIDSRDFRGGEMLSLFGEINIDLRGAQIAMRKAVIDANATFGAVNIKVPETWRVSVRGAGIFGGYEDKTIPPRPQAGFEPPLLIITGAAIFGAVVVKN